MVYRTEAFIMTTPHSRRTALKSQKKMRIIATRVAADGGGSIILDTSSSSSSSCVGRSSVCTGGVYTSGTIRKTKSVAESC